MAERTQSYYHNYRLHNDLSENCTLLLQDYLIASLERIEKKHVVTQLLQYSCILDRVYITHLALRGFIYLTLILFIRFGVFEY